MSQDKNILRIQGEHLRYPACSIACEQSGCQLWSSFFMRCVRGARTLAEPASSEPAREVSAQQAQALRALTMRAFALPLVLFIVSAGALGFGVQASDAWALALFAAALGCGWISVRRWQILRARMR